MCIFTYYIRLPAPRVNAAAIRCRSSRRRETQQVAAEPGVEKAEGESTDKVWDGKSRPKRSVRSEAIPLDTRNWEVAGQRTDVRYF